MRILIKQDAGRVYQNTLGRYQPINWEWKEQMDKVSGMWIEVETDFLFSDQFNTVPIDGVSENGLRIMSQLVESIEADERIGKMRCNYCGKISDTNIICNHCKETKYLEVFKTGDGLIIR